mgnify:CR=1 FL=1
MEIAYQIRRSDRRTIAIQILADGTVLVRAPRRMPRAQIADFVESKRRWIEKHLRCHSGATKFTREELAKLKQIARIQIHSRLPQLAALAGVSYNRVSFRFQRTRWGSCSAKGNLNFNCLLALVPAEILDYVLVHELCHRKELNHSAQFWTEVERVLPDYKSARLWLKENGAGLIARLP